MIVVYKFCLSWVYLRVFHIPTISLRTAIIIYFTAMVITMAADKFSTLVHDNMYLAEEPVVNAASAFMQKPTNFCLYMDKDYSSKDGYWLDVHGCGRDDAPRDLVLGVFAKAIDGLISGIDSSDLVIRLDNKQYMEIQLSHVEKFDLRHFEVKIESPRDDLSDPIFAEIAQRVYGLEFGSGFTNGEAPCFDGDPSEGYFVKSLSGLKHGTIPQREAYAVIRKHRERFSRRELNVLRQYDPALTKPMADKSEQKTIILQKDGLVPTSKFVDLFNQFPEGVKEIGIMVSDYKSGDFIYVHTAMKHRDRKDSPWLQYHAFPGTKEDLDHKLDTFWGHFHKLSDVSLEQIAKCFEKG